MTSEFPHKLEKTFLIRASREIVFRFFTDSERWAAWWGPGSTIEARVGGQMLIRLPGGTEVAGEVLELQPPERIGFTYGFVTGAPVAPGTSYVTIRLEATPDGTRVHLTHAFANSDAMQGFEQGWRYQLSLFSNVIADELHARSTETIDRWFAMWSNPVAAERWQELDRLAASNINVQDRFSAVEGIIEVRAHLDAVHTFMPGIQLRREGDARQCQGKVLAPWKATGSDGQLRGTGASVFTLTAAGQVESVVGFWVLP